MSEPTFKQNGSWSYQFSLDFDTIYLRTVRKRSGTLHHLVRIRCFMGCERNRPRSPRHRISDEVWNGIYAIIQMEPDVWGVLALVRKDMRSWHPSRAKQQFEEVLDFLDHAWSVR